MLKSETNLSLPFITAQLPGIGGELRATPDDFVVEELPLYAPGGEGQHLYVSLTKVGATTRELQAQLAKLFGVSPGEVGFAGMKDKHARTTQTFSLNVGHQPPGFADEAAQRIRDQLPVTVHWAQFHKNKLKLGHLLGNRFEITISGLACSQDEALRRADEVAQAIKVSGTPNYFGPQRFGQSGGNVHQGFELLTGERRQRDRWLRKFLISSYQSYLCNRYLARRVDSGRFERLLHGDVAKKVDTGGVFDVEDVTIEQARYVAHEINFTAPIFGAKMRPAHHEAGELEAAVLAEGKVTVDHFRRARSEGTRRPGRLLIDDLAIAPVSAGIKLCFALPKGAFATTVLREFMKVEPNQPLAEENDEDE